MRLPHLLYCLLSGVMAFSVPLATAGPFDDWSYRTPIQLNNAGGTETLLNFPLLVNLNAGNFDFGKAKADGSDVRFALPGGTLLSYEIEKWDPVASTAAVWVKVPQIDLGPAAGLINMYTGNAAAADAQNIADVWSNGYVGVWHLGASLNDSTGSGNHGTASGTVTLASGLAGDARLFDLGSISTLAVSNGSLDMDDNISVSYWMRGAAADQPGSFTRVVAKNSDSVSGWEYQRGGADAHQSVRIDTSAGNNQVRSNAPGAFDGEWHFVGTTLGSGAVRGYMDDGTPIVNSYGVGGGFGNSLPLVIGARAAGSTSFRGLVDEVRVSNVVRTDAWMNAEYRSQTGQMAVLGGTILVVGLVAEYSHEATNPLMDTSGQGHDALAGGATFVATPADTQGFAAGLGATVGAYARTADQYLGVPASVIDPIGAIDPAEGFTFTALVHKNDLVMGGHRTILASNRFRFQWSTSGTTQEEREAAGQLRIDITGGGNTVTPAGGFPVDTWYFTALQYDGAGNRGAAYLIPASAVLAGPTFSFTPTTAMTNISAFRIGGDGLSGIGSLDGWDGYIDNARFYQGTLSKRQLRDVFNSYTGHLGPIGLVAQYTHENAANRLADDTGHGLTLTNAGGVSFAAPPNPGGFDLGDTVGQYSGASDSYLTVPELYTAGDDFTFLAMVRVNADSGHQTILGSDRFRLQYYPVTDNDGRGSLLLQVNADGASGPISSTYGSFTPSEWHLVAMMYDAETKKIETYVQPDSPVLFGSAFTQTALGAEGLDTMTRFRLGADGLSGIGSPDALAGHIDGVRFYDQTFTKVQLRDIFREYRPAPPGPIGLLAHYTHDSANPLADDTGHLATLTNRGGTTFVPSGPTDPGPFQVGDTVAQFTRAGNDGLDVPSIHTSGDDFTFVALVRKNSEETGHQTILSSNRFRYQYRDTGGVNDAGTLRLELSAGGGTTESGDNTFRTGEWYFTAFSYNAATGQIFNYLQDSSPVFRGPAGSLTANLDDMTRFQIGYNGLSGIGSGDAFGGWIDGARFYDQALTTLQLRDVFRTVTGHAPGPIGLVVRFDHENPANRLEDTSGNALHATNGGGVTFTAPIDPGPFDLGTTVGQYSRTSTGYLDVPNVHTPGDDFTFTAMVRKDSAAAGHHTIFSTNRFRLQFRGTSDNAGVLRLDVNGAGASPPGETAIDGFPTQEWMFVAMTYDAATRQIQAWLQDGSPVFLGPDMTRTALGAIGIDDMSSFQVGGNISGIGSGDWFRGQMDGVRFYDTLLTKRELRDVFREYNPLPAGAVGLVAEYTHEGPNPLADDTGHGLTAVNRGLVSFVAPPPGGIFRAGLGNVVGHYPRQDNGSLDSPQFYTSGDDFTFTALVRKDSDESGGHQTILASDRFRLQFQDTGTAADGLGQLLLEVNDAGSSGPTGSGAGTFATDEWYFVALRYDAGSQALHAFLDSEELGGPVISQVVNAAMGLDDMLNFRVGADGLSGLGSPDPFGGWIDRVQFYDRFLTDVELRQLFTSAIPEPSAAMLLLLGLMSLPLVRQRHRPRIMHRAGRGV
ncbi:MAG: DUF2341 domain-containing protein [Thermoguttaceae bacterium]|jgi:hypothetical protein|nr:DUF2341 domain-containing protein [Thermoguttaceae bacterium]